MAQRAVGGGHRRTDEHLAVGDAALDVPPQAACGHRGRAEERPELGVRPRPLDDVAVARDERPRHRGVVAVALEERCGVLGDGDGRAQVPLDGGDLCVGALDDEHDLVGDRMRRADRREPRIRQRRGDAIGRLAQLRVEDVIDDVGPRQTHRGDRRLTPFERRGELGLRWHRRCRWLERRGGGIGPEPPGVMLQPRDRGVGDDRGDVALGVGGVDHHEGVVERRTPVRLGVQSDGWPPRRDRLDERP